MSLRPLVVSVAMLAAAILASAASAFAQTSRPGGPSSTAPTTRASAFTYHDHYRRGIEYGQSALLDVYRQHGQRDARWDGAVEAYLTATIQRIAADDVPPYYRPTDMPSSDDLVRLAIAARDAGSEDPLVLFGHALAMSSKGRSRADTVAALREAIDAMDRSRYSLSRKLGCRVQLARAVEDKVEADEILEAVRKRIPEACAGRMSDHYRRLGLPFIWGLCPDRNAQRDMSEALAARPDVDPWLRHMVAAKFAMSLAWDIRGNGPAAGVSPDAMKGFVSHLKTARDELARAWQASPNCPEAPAELIRIASAGGKELNEDKFEWFSRALAAQYDYLPAYEILFAGIGPRWGGTPEEMLKMAEACIAEPRYDTLVPWQYVLVVREVGELTGTPWGPLARPDIYDRVATVLERYGDWSAAHGRPQGRDNYYSLRAALPAKFDRLKEARTYLDRIESAGGKPVAEAFRLFGIDSPYDVVGLIHALTGPNEAAIRDATARAARQREYDAALRSFREMQGKLPADDPSAPFYRDAIALIDADRLFHAGEWSPLVRTSTLRDFVMTEGQWEVDDDRRVTGNGTGDATPALLWRGRSIQRDPGRSFELRAKVSFPKEGQVAGRPHAAGFCVMHLESKRRGYVLVERERQKAGYFFTKDPVVLPAEVADGTELRLKVDDHEVTFFVDGRQIGEPYALGGAFAGEIAVGIGGINGLPIRFSDLAVKRAAPVK